MSIEMADHKFDFDHSGLQEVANAVREDTAAEGAGGAQKRKRDESADASRRPSSKQRISVNNSNDVDDAFMDEHQDPNAAVESLQEYANLPDSSNGDEHANASSTAAAALGIFPTMTVPQPTDMTFQSQSVDADRNQDSFMDDSQGGDQSFSMDNQQATPSGRGNSKPVVGSEEWHKVRKDNHKEGK